MRVTIEIDSTFLLTTSILLPRDRRVPAQDLIQWWMREVISSGEAHPLPAFPTDGVQSTTRDSERNRFTFFRPNP